MKFINHDFVRILLVMLTLCSVIIDWSFPNRSCACASAQLSCFINNKSDNLEFSSCSFCKDSQVCSCCIINEQYFDSNSYNADSSGIFDATKCQCELHSNGLLSSKIIISEIQDSKIFKPQFYGDTYYFSFYTIVDKTLNKTYNRHLFKDINPISLTMLYCQLNI
jgi:hypothetical protein